MASPTGASNRTETTLRVMTSDAFIMLLLGQTRICPAAARMTVGGNSHGEGRDPA